MELDQGVVQVIRLFCFLWLWLWKYKVHLYFRALIYIVGFHFPSMFYFQFYVSVLYYFCFSNFLPFLRLVNSFLCCIFLCAVLCLVIQLYPTLCDPMDCSPPGSSVHGILQARMLEWVAIPSSRSAYEPKVWTQVSHIACRFFTIWVTREAKNSGAYPFSRRSSWPKNQTGVSCIAGRFFTNWPTRETLHISLLTCSYLFILSVATLKMTAWVMTYYSM